MNDFYLLSGTTGVGDFGFTGVDGFGFNGIDDFGFNGVDGFGFWALYSRFGNRLSAAYCAHFWFMQHFGCIWDDALVLIAQ